MKNFYKKIIAFLFITAFSGLFANIFAQCPAEQKEVVISIIPDQYPQEISWTLTSDATIIASGTSTGTTLCVDPDVCLTFRIMDSAGDGICCQYGTGSYTVTLDGTVVASGGNYTNEQSTLFN